MLSTKQIPFRRRRNPPATAAPGVLNALSVQDINYDGDALALTVVFDTTADEPLNAVGAAAPGKWNARYDGKRFEGIGLVLLAYNKLYVSMSEDDVDAGANELNYTNAPSDISDALGRKLAAFAHVSI